MPLSFNDLLENVSLPLQFLKPAFPASVIQLSSLSVLVRLFADFVIHGFIPAGRANHYMSSLKAGSIMKVDRFEVARCSSMYTIIDHPFLIRFISPTIIMKSSRVLLRSISQHN
ncbi:hypothetical protein YC2023_023782 [Brassica napus]